MRLNDRQQWFNHRRCSMHFTNTTYVARKTHLLTHIAHVRTLTRKEGDQKISFVSLRELMHFTFHLNFPCQYVCISLDFRFRFGFHFNFYHKWYYAEPVNGCEVHWFNHWALYQIYIKNAYDKYYLFIQLVCSNGNSRAYFYSHAHTYNVWRWSIFVYVFFNLLYRSSYHNQLNV